MEIISRDKITSVRFDIFPTNCQAQMLEEWAQKYTCLIKDSLAGANEEEISLNYSAFLQQFTSHMKYRIERDVWLIRKKIIRNFSTQLLRCNHNAYKLVRGKISLRLRTKLLWLPTDGTFIPRNRQGTLTIFKANDKWKAEILLWVKSTRGDKVNDKKHISISE